MDPTHADDTGFAADTLSAQQSAQLCQSCGLCCNGTLFAYLTVKPQEQAEAKAAGLPLYRNKKRELAMDLPCSALQGTRCTVYENRPGACRSFLCRLTRDVMNGSKSLDDAAGEVATLKGRAGWLLSNIPDGALPEGTVTSQGCAPRAPKTAGDVLTAWQQARPVEPDSASISLALLLGVLHPVFLKKQQAGALTDAEKTYISAAFGYAKQVDRSFDKSRLLRKYAELVQAFDA